MANIHCLTNVPFEDAANIGLWAQENGHQLKYTHLYNNDPLPEIDDFDVLAIMGGPMNIYEYDKYP
jgi:GMP synthase (glutamine-hydrolysing)